ncbi:prolyl oligopeptidase family serine peptidase [Streptomyces sp. LS1784]|uniref:S9 family peptidase n=1 Tax=Streptomyces sp. LS1784 TaxID=2851533 RepID=UPI001CCB26B4|nr:prolyl oligopeptidase family serine peptidase [Streptomyces sp. LS1784]
MAGSLWWLQSDPDHGGVRRVMCSERSGIAFAVTPSDFSVGSELHAYGGGSFAVVEDAVWFVGDDGSLFRQPLGCTPDRIVPVCGSEQYGDLAPGPDGRVFAVRGDSAADEIVAVSPAGSVQALVRSSEFLSCPRLAEGTLAYLEWKRDQMPWDSCRLLLADIRSGLPGPGRVVAGGRSESVGQPSWGPDGLLYFMSDRTGWWNLYRLRDDTVTTILPTDADCAPAPWEAGYQSYGFAADGALVLTVLDGFSTKLMAVDPAGIRRRLGPNLTSVKPYIAVDDGRLAVIGSTPSSAPGLWSLDLTAQADALAVPVSPESASAPPWTPTPPSIDTAQVTDGHVRFLLHRPAGAAAPVPLLVRAHPGPTDDVPLRLDWTTQFFVSHGFAVAEVLYRGSTGRGRAFRQVLHGHWGEYDVEDCAAVAEHLRSTDVALPGAMFITGASAGGYTALQAASRPGPFAGATATSAIIDPARWELSVPDFQRPHAAVLRGTACAVTPERIRCPVLVIHSTADTITSAKEAMQLAQDLAALGGDHDSLLLDDGDHYLSAPAAREQALRAELDFYRRLMSRPRA